MTKKTIQDQKSTQDMDEKAKERLRKILTLMTHSPSHGEREAAKQAGLRMASQYGMSLEEAVRFVQTPDGTATATQRREEAAQKAREYQNWQFTHGFYGEADYLNRRRAWAEAVRQAEQRKRQEQGRTAPPEDAHQFGQAGPNPNWQEKQNAHQATQKPSWTPRYRPSTYRPTPEDRFRLISGLLLDGAGLATTCNLADASREEVLRVWMSIRHDRKAKHKNAKRRSAPLSKARARAYKQSTG